MSIENNLNEFYKNMSDIKCGIILFTNSAKFNFACLFCSKTYNAANCLLEHIQNTHLNILEEYDEPCEENPDTAIEYLSPLKLEPINVDNPINSSFIKVENKKHFFDKFESFLSDSNIYDESLNDLSHDNVKYDNTIPSEEVVLVDDDDSSEFQQSDIVNFKVEPGVDDESITILNEPLSDEMNMDELDPSKEAKKLKTCYICSKIFRTNQKLSLHLTGVHKIDPNFQCKECKQNFCTQTILLNHMKRHNKERKHICEFCHARFTDPSNLKVHIMRHKGIKPHKCKLCVKKFHSTTELKIHLRVHTGEKPFICEFCGKKFTNSGHLVSHKRRHTNERNYACVICNKRFFDMKLLKDHMVCHSNERPFGCDKCDATFQRKKALIQHHKLHSEKKAYECNICGKSFAQNAGLYSHTKSHRKC